MPAEFCPASVGERLRDTEREGERERENKCLQNVIRPASISSDPKEGIEPAEKIPKFLRRLLFEHLDAYGQQKILKSQCPAQLLCTGTLERVR